MENTLLFLTVVLSVFLAIFLLVGVILMVKSIQAINRIKHIAETADKVMFKVDGMAEFLQKTSGTLALGKLLARFVEHIKNKESKKEEDK